MTENQLDFRDRSVWLLVFGIVEILIGILCALFALLTTILTVMTILTPPAQNPQALSFGLSPRAAFPSLSLYALLGLVFIALGIGSIRARSWARKWSLSIAWIWLFTGLSSILLMAFVWPSLIDVTSSMSGLPMSWVTMILLIGFLLTAATQVVLPGFFILFYRSADVIATIKARNGDLSESDQPTHVLSLCLVYLLFAYSALLIPVYGIKVPFFGMALTSWPALLVITLSFGIYLWLAWACLKSPRFVFPLGMGTSIFAMIATTSTFYLRPIGEFFESMPLSEEEIVFLQSVTDFDRSYAVWISIATWLSLIAYQVFTRKLFEVPSE